MFQTALITLDEGIVLSSHLSHHVRVWNRSHRIGARNRSDDIHSSVSSALVYGIVLATLAVGIVLIMSVGLVEKTAATFFREILKGREKCKWER